MKDPIAGIVDYDAVEYYRDVIHEIKKNGMEPVIHWNIGIFQQYYLKNIMDGLEERQYIFMNSM